MKKKRKKRQKKKQKKRRKKSVTYVHLQDDDAVVGDRLGSVILRLSSILAFIDSSTESEDFVSKDKLRWK